MWPDYNRALQRDPSNAVAHAWYADYLSNMGRHTEAVAEARRARELDPVSVDRNSSLDLFSTARADTTKRWRYVRRLSNSILTTPRATGSWVSSMGKGANLARPSRRLRRRFTFPEVEHPTARFWPTRMRQLERRPKL
jgi:tetratricopeptide (TPR) repeat protein